MNDRYPLLHPTPLIPTESIFHQCGTPQTITSAQTESSIITEEVVTTETMLYPNVPDTNWNGETFHVLGRDNPNWQFITFEIIAEADTSDVVNDAIFRRNTQIEEKYNVKITQTLNGDTQKEISNLVAWRRSV